MVDERQGLRHEHASGRVADHGDRDRVAEAEAVPDAVAAFERRVLRRDVRLATAVLLQGSELEPGGQAVEVSYSNDKSVNSMRTAVYQYNQENNVKIRSGKDAANKKIYFYREK